MTNITPAVISSPDRGCLPAAGDAGVRNGEVVLVGAGPGDPELLTLKAVRALQCAQVLVYDRLVHPDILACAPQACERIYAGKRKDHHSLPQETIGRLLVARARKGKRVIRLKGGDPFVFGRGGEELDCLEAEGIPWRAIPGVTAATGCTAATGIPLTHRDCAHAVTFITAHRRHGELAFNWSLVLQPEQTVVFYMGLSVAGEIAEGLMARGRGGDTPAAVVANGTLSEQRLIVATLSTLAERVSDSALPSPALIIVGEVVNRRAALREVVASVSA